jgi:hypothetical protein
MKKIYSRPAMEVVPMEGNDVIVTSPLRGGDQSRPIENGYGEAPNRRNAIWDE